MGSNWSDLPGWLWSLWDDLSGLTKAIAKAVASWPVVMAPNLPHTTNGPALRLTDYG